MTTIQVKQRQAPANRNLKDINEENTSIHNLEAENKILKGYIKSLNKAVEDLKIEKNRDVLAYNALDEKYISRNKETTEVRAILATSKNKVYNALNIKEDLNDDTYLKKLNELISSYKTHDTTIKKLEAEKKDLIKNIDSLTKNNAKWSSDYNSLTTERNVCKKNIADIERLLTDHITSEEYNAITQHLNNEKDLMVNISKRIEDIKNKIKAQNEEIKNLNEQLEGNTSINDSYVNAYNSITVQIEALLKLVGEEYGIPTGETDKNIEGRINILKRSLQERNYIIKNLLGIDENEKLSNTIILEKYKGLKTKLLELTGNNNTSNVGDISDYIQVYTEKIDVLYKLFEIKNDDPDKGKKLIEQANNYLKLNGIISTLYEGKECTNIEECAGEIIKRFNDNKSNIEETNKVINVLLKKISNNAERDDIKNNNEAVEAFTKEVNSLVEINKRLINENNELVEQLKLLQEENMKIQAENKSHLEKINQLEKELASNESKYKKLEKEKASLIAENEALKISLNDDFQNLEEQTEKVSNQLAYTDKIIKELDKEINELKTQNTALQNENDELKSKIKGLEGELGLKKEELEEAKKVNEEQAKAITQYEEQLEELKDRYSKSGITIDENGIVISEALISNEELKTQLIKENKKLEDCENKQIEIKKRLTEFLIPYKETIDSANKADELLNETAEISSDFLKEFTKILTFHADTFSDAINNLKGISKLSQENIESIVADNKPLQSLLKLQNSSSKNINVSDIEKKLFPPSSNSNVVNQVAKQYASEVLEQAIDLLTTNKPKETNNIVINEKYKSVIDRIVLDTTTAIDEKNNALPENEKALLAIDIVNGIVSKLIETPSNNEEYIVYNQDIVLGMIGKILDADYNEQIIIPDTNNPNYKAINKAINESITNIYNNADMSINNERYDSEENQRFELIEDGIEDNTLALRQGVKNETQYYINQVAINNSDYSITSFIKKYLPLIIKTNDHTLPQYTQDIINGFSIELGNIISIYGQEQFFINMLNEMVTLIKLLQGITIPTNMDANMELFNSLNCAVKQYLNDNTKFLDALGISNSNSLTLRNATIGDSSIVDTSNMLNEKTMKNIKVIAEIQERNLENKAVIEKEKIEAETKLEQLNKVISRLKEIKPIYDNVGSDGNVEDLLDSINYYENNRKELEDNVNSLNENIKVLNKEIRNNNKKYENLEDTYKKIVDNNNRIHESIIRFNENYYEREKKYENLYEEIVSFFNKLAGTIKEAELKENEYKSKIILLNEQLKEIKKGLGIHGDVSYKEIMNIVNNYKLEITSLKEFLKISEAENKNLRKYIQELQNTINEQDAKILTLVAKNETLREEMNEMKQKYNVLFSEYDTKIATIKQQNEYINKLYINIENLNIEITKLRNNEDALNYAVEEVSKRIKDEETKIIDIDINDKNILAKYFFDNSEHEKHIEVVAHKQLLNSKKIEQIDYLQENMNSFMQALRNDISLKYRLTSPLTNDFISENLSNTITYFNEFNNSCNDQINKCKTSLHKCNEKNKNLLFKIDQLKQEIIKKDIIIDELQKNN